MPRHTTPCNQKHPRTKPLKKANEEKCYTIRKEECDFALVLRDGWQEGCWQPDCIPGSKIFSMEGTVLEKPKGLVADMRKA